MTPAVQPVQTIQNAPSAVQAASAELTWYFDFISPYAYLQSEQLTAFESAGTLQLKPILFAGLLKHWGQLGPAEITPKREWTFTQIVWLAQQHKIPMKLPPAHPFNPLPFLRLAIACQCSRESIKTIFRYIWMHGHSFEQTSDFAALCATLGKTVEDLEAQWVKDQLRTNTEQAIGHMIFGVPTMRVQWATQEVKQFWGFDSTEMALSYSCKEPFWSSVDLQAAIDLPNGLQRNR